jgi:hypothetical protein
MDPEMLASLPADIRNAVTRVMEREAEERQRVQAELSEARQRRKDAEKKKAALAQNLLQRQNALLLQRNATFLRNSIPFSSVMSIDKYVEDVTDVSAVFFGGRAAHASSLDDTLSSMGASGVLRDAIGELYQHCCHQLASRERYGSFLVCDTECAQQTLDAVPFTLVQQCSIEYWSALGNVGIIAEGLRWIHDVKVRSLRGIGDQSGASFIHSHALNRIGELLDNMLKTENGVPGNRNMVEDVYNDVMRIFSCGGGLRPLKIPDQALLSNRPAPAGAPDLLLCWSRVPREPLFPLGRPILDSDIVRATTADESGVVLNTVGTVEWNVESRSESSHHRLDQALAECVAAACQVDTPCRVIPVSAVGAMVDRNEATWLFATRMLDTTPDAADLFVEGTDEDDEAASSSADPAVQERVVHRVRYIKQTFARTGGSSLEDVIAPFVLMFSLCLFEAWYRQLISDADLGLQPADGFPLTMLMDAQSQFASTSSSHTERSADVADESMEAPLMPPPLKKQRTENEMG